MSLIMVIDDMAVIREPIAAALTSAGHEAVCAGGGEEALGMMRRRVPQLVILDLSMPKMDGMAVLRAMRSFAPMAKTPVILLTATVDKEHILEARKLGVHDYILKSSFSLSGLIERAAKCLAEAAGAGANGAKTAAGDEKKHAATGGAGGADAGVAVAVAGAAVVVGPAKLLSREETLKRAHSDLQAKTLSGVVSQVMSLADSPRTGPAELASLISRDSVLSARVLHAANSAAYSAKRGGISRVDEAVRTVGCSAIRNIAATVAIYDAIPASAADGFNAIRFWEHSLATALVCERLEEGKPRESAGLAYLVGLCHDLGEILIRARFEEEYRAIIECAEERGEKALSLFRPMLGISYGELVSVVLESVGLPESIRTPIDKFHLTAGVGGWPTNEMSRVLALADSYVLGCLLAPTGGAPLMSYSRVEWGACGGGAAGALLGGELSPEPLRGRVLTMTSTLAGMSAAQEKALLTPGYVRGAGRVLVVRDPALSECDGVEMALRAMCEVEVLKGPMTQAVLAKQQGVVILSGGAAYDQTVEDWVMPEIRKFGGAAEVLWVGRHAAETEAKKGGKVRRVLYPVSLDEVEGFTRRLDVERAGVAA